MHDFFPTYAARISLLHAHLAHALGDTERAGTFYRVAAHLNGAGPVGSGLSRGGAARADEALLCIRLSTVQLPPPSSVSPAEQSNLQLDASTTSRQGCTRAVFVRHLCATTCSRGTHFSLGMSKGIPRVSWL